MPTPPDHSLPPFDTSLFFRRLMESLPDFVYFKDRKGRFLSVSQYHASAFGFDNPEDLRGKSDADYFEPSLAEQKAADERAIVASGQGFTGKEEAISRNGEIVAWVMTSKLPLRAETGEVVGTFGISRDITAQKRAELETAQARQELEEKNRQMAAELAVAREMQANLMASSLAAMEANLTSGTGRPPQVRLHYAPCAFLAGDFVHAVSYSPDCFGLFVCDVMGHGVKAALVTTLLRGLLTDVSEEGLSAAEVLTQLNDRLCPLLDQPTLPRFVTATFLRFDLKAARVEVASAGHLWPLFKPAQGSAEPISREECGAALGFLIGSTYHSHERALAPGDRILAYTDGWIEEANDAGEEFGVGRLLSALDAHAAVNLDGCLSGMASAVAQHTRKREFADDLCALLVEI